LHFQLGLHWPSLTAHKFDVVGVGANSVDHVCVLPAPVQTLGPSGKMPITARHVLYGGQTATTMGACATFGLRASYVGAFGSDAEAQGMRRALQRSGVDLDRSVERGAPNASAVILLDGSTGHRIVLWDRSDDLRLRPEELPADLLVSARLVHVDDADEEAAIGAARAAAAAGVPVTSDIDRITASTEALIAAVTYPIFDQQVSLALTGLTDPRRALKKLRRLNTGVLCTTLGDRGAIALEGDHLHVVPACKVQVVDSTGAGDVFRAGFIYGLLAGWEFERVLRFANAAAALSCTKLGALASVPSLPEVQGLVASGTS